MTNRPNELRRIAGATRNSLAGLWAALRHEASFRSELVAAVFLIPLALWLGRGPVERALLVASVLFVLVIELLNSALEATMDRISLERHPLAKRAKDMGSAAVMAALILAAAVWLLVLLP